MKLCEVFENLRLDYKIESLFGQCEVTGISMLRNKSKIVVNIASDELIGPAYLYVLRDALQGQFFFDSGCETEVCVTYPKYHDRKLTEIWDDIKGYINEIILVRDHLDGICLKDAEFVPSDEGITVTLPDYNVTRARRQAFIDEVGKAVSDVTGTTCNVFLNYKPRGEEVDVEDEPILSMQEFLAKNEAARLRAESRKRAGEKPKDLQPRKPVEKTDNASDNADKPKYRKSAPADPDIFYGKSFEIDRVMPICDIQDEIGDVIIAGQICSCEKRQLKSGDRYIIIFCVTDFTDTISVKLFIKEDRIGEVEPELKPGKFVMLRGIAQMDQFDHEIGIGSVSGIKRYHDTRIKRTDYAEKKRVELHAHTKMSDMDAVTETKELVMRAFEWGHPAVAITDHGVVQSFVEASHAIDPKKFADDPEKTERFKKFKIIYGCEGYIVDDEALKKEDGSSYDPEVPEDREVIKKLPRHHIILLAKNDIGRVNLYRLVSWSHIHYFHTRPNIPKSILRKYREGIIVGSACEQGELFRAIIEEKDEAELRRIRDFYDYYEIQPTGNNAFLIREEGFPKITTEQDLQEINKKIIQLADEDNKLCVATCDVHFLNPEDEIYRRIIMASKYKDADLQPPLYFRTTDEMLEEFSYLPRQKAYEIVVENTNKINDMIERIKPVRPDKCPPVIENSDRDLREMCYNTAHSMYGENLPVQVSERLEKELQSIIKNGFAVMYIIAQRLVKHSNDDGYMVGSRGSVGSSFVATMSGITEVNPLPAHYYCPKCHFYDFDSDEVKAYAQKSGFDMPDRKCPVCGTPLKKDGQNIPFETFLGFKGDKEPDIDLNFSGDNQSEAHAYTEVLFGKGHTFRAGTISGIADNTAFGLVKNYYSERNITKRMAEINRLIGGFVGVKRSTGQHPGGIVVLPHGEEIYSFTPVQKPANDMTTDTITTHFDYHSIDHNLLKLDILGHDDPTMVRFLEDLTGIPAKEIPMDDRKVVSLFASTEALGITPEDLDGCDLGSLGLPELGTEFVMQMLRDTKPQSFSDMIRISGLSHGTDVWLNNTQTLIEEKKCTLSNAICTRDDIMTYLISMGVENSLSFKIMESVRKGKGLTPEMEDAMREKNVPDWYLWSCKRIKYMFPKAHACAYVMMAFRIAYCKVYYPLAYYTAYFSIRAKGFSYEVMCMGKEKMLNSLKSLRTRSKSNDPAKKLSDKEENQFYTMRICQEMYARGYEFMPIDIYRVKATKFQIIDGKIMPSLNSIDGLGENVARQIEEGAKGDPFLSKEDMMYRCHIGQSVIDLLSSMGILDGLSDTNQLSFMDLLS